MTATNHNAIMHFANLAQYLGFRPVACRPHNSLNRSLIVLITRFQWLPLDYSASLGALRRWRGDRVANSVLRYMPNESAQCL